MALTNCPHCGKKVSTSAKKCPHCGVTLIPPVPTEIHQDEPHIRTVAPLPLLEKDNAPTPAEPLPISVETSSPSHNNVLQANETSPQKHPWKWIVLISAIVLVLGGGGMGYWYYQNIYMPEKIDREAPRTFPLVNVQLRSSKMAGGDFNKLLTVPFGSELITYSSDNEWAKVKYIDPSSEVKKEGFVAAPYLIDRKDFYILNSLLGDNDVREVVATAKVRKALLDYFKKNNFVGKLPDELLAEVGLTATADNQWQVLFRHGQEKPNEVLFKRLTNQQSKYTDMAVLIENIKSHSRKILFFSFDDDETPHLIFEGSAPSEGDISDVTKNGYTYLVKYTTDTREYQ